MSDQGLIAIVPSLLWFALALALLAAFWRQLADVLDATSARIRAGAPFGLGWLRVEAPPEVRSGRAREATAEGPGGAGEGSPATAHVEARVEARDYPPHVTDALYLVHQAEVVVPPAPNARGLFRVRVWLEADPPERLAEVTRVTYRLHDTFSSRRVIATTARDKRFELWLNVYGEFNLVAYVQRGSPSASGRTPYESPASGAVAGADRPSDSELWLMRYLDLPGRPPD